jgi:antitoxin MazE
MIRSWGNSQGIILSREVIKSAGVKVGDTLDISVKDGVISLSRPFRHKTLEERIAESNVPLTLSGEMDFGEPKGREIW